MSYQLTTESFSTNNNLEIFQVILPDSLVELHLEGFIKVDDARFIDNNVNSEFFELQWPPNLKYLKTMFRPNFSRLPHSLRKLHVLTQTQILKKDLPVNLKTLIIECPNSEPSEFYPLEDDYDLYKISIDSFGESNQFVGGYFSNDSDNVKHHQVSYMYYVEGDDV